MIGRIVEIQNTGFYLSKDRGFLVIKGNDGETSRIPLSDVTSLILSGYDTTISTGLLNALQEEGALVVFTGRNHHPSNLLWPITSHYHHQARIHIQIGASKPLKKRVWQTIIQSKIRHQGIVLEKITGHDLGLIALSKEVKSGDPNNREAQAARKYWPALMGKSFRRDPNAEGINGLLNYGYAILRASVARSVSASGLHPALGIHHTNKSNSFCLVDDLMEVFRPLIDLTVRRLSDDNKFEITPDTKKILVATLHQDLSSEHGRSPLANCIQKMVQSYIRSLESGKVELQFPLSILPFTQLNSSFIDE